MALSYFQGLDLNKTTNELIDFLLTTNNTEIHNYERQANQILMPLLEMLYSK